MKVSVIKEIKDRENRVSLTPDGARRLIDAGNAVLIDKNAGVNSGFLDSEYIEAGAEIVDTKKAWDADLVIKVKEPLEAEYNFLRDQIVFTYLHLAGVTKALTEAFLEKKTTAIAYETTEDAKGRLPLLAPMSAVAGNMSVTMGSYYLAKFNKGRGMQLGSVLGKKYGKVVVIGDGIVGRHAAKTAYAMGANVYIFTRHEDRFAGLKKEIGSELNCVLSEKENVAEHGKIIFL